MNATIAQKDTFFKLHTIGPVGSFHRAFFSVRDVAREILRDMNDPHTISLRLAELEYNDERTLGKRVVQDVKIRPNLRTRRGR